MSGPDIKGNFIGTLIDDTDRKAGDMVMISSLQHEFSGTLMLGPPESIFSVRKKITKNQQLLLLENELCS